MLNIKSSIASAFVAATLAFSPAAFAASPASYQVTGVVKSVTDSAITVVKGKENFEIARTAATKVTGDIAVGAKVTVQYTMTAVSVEAKAAKAKKAHTQKIVAPAATPKAA